MFLKLLLYKEASFSLYPINNEQYLGMNTINGSFMKIKVLITNISFQSYQLVITLLNPAHLMLFVDLTRSFIQARKLLGFFVEQSLQVGLYGAFIKQCLTKQKRILL